MLVWMTTTMAPALWPTEQPASGPSTRAAASARLWAVLAHLYSQREAVTGLSDPAGPGCRAVPRTLQSWNSWRTSSVRSAYPLPKPEILPLGE